MLGGAHIYLQSVALHTSHIHLQSVVLHTSHMCLQLVVPHTHTHAPPSTYRDRADASFNHVADIHRFPLSHYITLNFHTPPQANHGGGYQYRLAPKEKDGTRLTEAEFQKTPLPFVGQQRLRWGGPAGTTLAFDGVYVSAGTTPVGSRWAQNPIPRNDVQNTGLGFAPHCNTTGVLRCEGMWDGGAKDGVGNNVAVPDLEIVDMVQIPTALPAGEYVLGWRWDCEESNQIWQSCSDLTIVV
jgi:hypothetical protein